VLPIDSEVVRVRVRVLVHVLGLWLIGRNPEEDLPITTLCWTMSDLTSIGLRSSF
jgi:hypothetical protein